MDSNEIWQSIKNACIFLDQNPSVSMIELDKLIFVYSSKDDFKIQIPKKFLVEEDKQLSIKTKKGK